ncbi:MAG TPA: hypothetical protein VKU41_31135 [Polyangiaceae bacterium]|nr:hypothetical protein [Polyangiaceae bacterium]
MRASAVGPRRTVAAIAAIAVFFSAISSEADELRLRVDWGKLADVLREGGATLTAASAWPTEGTPAPTSTMRWLGASPDFSIVARDWGSTQLLVGRLSLTDQSRVTRSSRMVVMRVRLTDGMLAPFAQLGLGQWRIDNDLLPTLPRDVELAGQLGGGFDLALARDVVLAVEGDYTLLYREQHEPQMVLGPHVWTTLLAARARF